MARVIYYRDIAKSEFYLSRCCITLIVSNESVLHRNVAQFGIEMQQGLAALSLQITLMERNLTKVKIPVRRRAGHFG